MPLLHVVTRDGKAHDIQAKPGANAMQAIGDAGINELLAICGGALSCATCHVYVADEDLGRLEPMGEFEDALLDGSAHRTANSRLSCQIILDESREGLSVVIAPEN